jgi:hypothetical protein
VVRHVHGENFVDLAGPSEPTAPKDEEDDFFFDLPGDDDNDADNLDYSASQEHRQLLFLV